MTTIVIIKMKLYETKTVYFNPPLIDVGGIQLLEYYSQYRKFSIFCDIIDSSYSLSNINSDGIIKPTKLLAIFSPSKLFPILPISKKKELTNITLWLKDEDMKPFYKSKDDKKDAGDDIIISLNIYNAT